MRARENFLFGRASFALEIAAGELACRRRFLAVVDREREEVQLVAGRAAGHGRHDDDGLAVGDDGGAVRLLGQFAGFDDEFFVANGGTYYTMLHMLVPTARQVSD